jgi:hypothetical protein
VRRDNSLSLLLQELLQQAEQSPTLVHIEFTHSHQVERSKLQVVRVTLNTSSLVAVVAVVLDLDLVAVAVLVDIERASLTILQETVILL